MPCAVKLLGHDYANDDELKRRFLIEGETGKRLTHPNIVRVLDVASAEDGTPYIVMDLLEGVPLSAYTRSGGRVPLMQAASILRGVLLGLSAAHAMGVVHRDLKPENVFLAREANGTFEAKLLDFGIAKVMDGAGGMGSKTRTGVLLGTPAYMSPEQIRNAKDVDARSDLWSVGVMFYEMLTGRVAFPAPTEYARLAEVLRTTPQAIELVDPLLVRASAFVQKAMQKDRDQRFQSASEMAHALTMALGVSNAPATVGMPLSRLPEVPSLMASFRVPSKSFAPESRAVTMPTEKRTSVIPVSNVGPSGTMASASGPPRPRGGEQGPTWSAPPLVVQVAPTGASQSTMPSEHLPMFRVSVAPKSERKGVSVAVLAVLLVLAILVGIGVGAVLFRGC
jgi:serine/threonine-protein kinase